MTGEKPRGKSGGRAGKRAVGSDPLDALDADRLSSLLDTGTKDRRKAGSEEAEAGSEEAEAVVGAAGASVIDGDDETTGSPLERGRLALADGRARAAVDAFREALRADPRDPDAAAGMAEALLTLGERDRAFEILLRTQEAHPDHVATRVQIGRAYARANAYPEAEAALQRAIRLDPSDPVARCELGVVLVKKGLYATAVGELERTLDLDAGQARAHYYLGTCHNQLDQLDRAAAAFERAIEVDPGDARAWYHLGVIHDRKGRPDRALEMYRKAREIEGGGG